MSTRLKNFKAFSKVYSLWRVGLGRSGPCLACRSFRRPTAGDPVDLSKSTRRAGGGPRRPNRHRLPKKAF